MKRLSFFLALTAAFALSSCDEDNNTPAPVNEEELITTVRLNFVSTATNDTLVFSSTDLDGDGADQPIVISPNLQDSTTYQVSVEFLNELESPAEDITAEVREEGAEHQVFFTFSDGLPILHSYDDSDANGDPIGLDNTLTTVQPASGEMTVILRHEPAKSAAGVADGDISNAGGATDAEVSFDIEIQ